MRADYTHITLVVDRSGSMSSCAEEAEGGINAFIKKQQAEPGLATFTLVQFDDDYDVVYNALPIRAVKGKYKLVPRGWTALNDAVARAIDETGAFLAAMPEEGRPALVMVAIVTDGYENASKKVTTAQVREKIEHQRNKYAWRFDYLGANQDPFAVAASMGIPTQDTMVFTGVRFQNAYAGLSGKASRLRTMSSMGATAQAMTATSYTEAEREASVGGSTTSSSTPLTSIGQLLSSTGLVGHPVPAGSRAGAPSPSVASPASEDQS